MKKLLLILLSIVPVLLTAQDKEKKDISKYLSGAVPTENGKVVFTKEINAPGLSKAQVYDIALKWLDTTLKENKNKSSIVYKNEEEGQVAGISEHYLVFKSSTFSLDRATAQYRILLTAQPGKCGIEINSIKYLYNGAQKSVPDKYAAEDLITDEMALNKAGTKMYNMPGKFRMKTVDNAEALFNSLQKALEAGVVKEAGAQTAVQPAAVPATTPVQQRTEPVKPATTGVTAPVTPPATATAPATVKNMEGYTRISADKIPGNIIKMLSEDWMLITAGNSAKFNTMTASWGGLGVLYNKPVAICFINPARYTYQFMENEDTYTLTFYTEAYREALNYCGNVSGRDTDKIKGSGLTPIATPDGSMAFSQAWMIIECRKLVSQSLSLDSINDKTEKEKRGTQPMHKMYIGEIINVWVK